MSRVNDPNRIASLDGVKGFLSLKIAFTHLGFFFAVPMLDEIGGVARDLSFPVLLFAFGIGTGISKRRKPAWPILVLAAAYLVGSLLNEAVVDRLVAFGDDQIHTMPHNLLLRVQMIASFMQRAHYTDFIQPYLLFLGIALVADRLGKPLRSWNPSLIIACAFAMQAIGFLLVSSSYTGPLSVFWREGYRSLQYAPLFVAGVLIGAHRVQWLQPVSRPKDQTLVALLIKLFIIKLVEDIVGLTRIYLGHHQAVWKEGDLVAVLGSIGIGLLAFSAYGDLKSLLDGRVVGIFEKVGRRTIISLCVQIVLLPIVAYFTIPILDHWIRALVALATWLLFAMIVLNWDRLLARARRQESFISDGALAKASA